MRLNNPLLAIFFLLTLIPAQAHATETRETYFEPSETRSFQSGMLEYITHRGIAKKLRDRLDNKADFFLVDLRKEVDFAQGSIEGSINVPIQKLSFLAEKMFQKTDDIVFYRYSNNDQAAINAVILLKNKGFGRVSFYEAGYDGWKKLPPKVKGGFK